MIPKPTAPRERLARELERVLLRLSALGPVRLARAGPSGVPADLVAPVLVWLADAAADAEGRPRRPVPALAPHALGDQLVVLVGDLDQAADAPTLAAAADRLATLRRSL